MNNMELYNVLCDKFQNSIYKVVFGSIHDELINARERFVKLKLQEQCTVLLNILSVFKTGRTGGCDLELIGVKAKCTYKMSSKISNWAKSNNCIKISNESSSGIFRTESDNILEWLWVFEQ